MAFEDIKTKLDSNTYDSMYSVKDDFNQMFVNAKRYNLRHSAIWEDAKELHRKLKAYWAKLTGLATEGDDPADEGDERPHKKQKKEKKEKLSSLTKWISAKVDALIAHTDPRHVFAPISCSPS